MSSSPSKSSRYNPNLLLENPWKLLKSFDIFLLKVQSGVWAYCEGGKMWLTPTNTFLRHEKLKNVPNTCQRTSIRFKLTCLQAIQAQASIPFVLLVGCCRARCGPTFWAFWILTNVHSAPYWMLTWNCEKSLFSSYKLSCRHIINHLNMIVDIHKRCLCFRFELKASLSFEQDSSCTLSGDQYCRNQIVWSVLGS